MLDTLLETRALGERGLSGRILSIIVHVAAIAVAVTATERTAAAAYDARPEHVSFVAPVEPPKPVDPPPAVLAVTPPPRGFQILVAPIEIPDVLPPVDLSRRITNVDDFTGQHGVPGGTANGDSTNRRPPIDAPLYAFQVDKPVVAMAGTETPEYPEVLRTGGIEGEELATFVVDTTGRADLNTFKALQSGHPLFTEAVKKALVRMKFLPAETGGRKVKQIVQMPFVFRIR